MIKNITKEKGNLIISHIADIDGMGSVCLANKVWNEVDYILVEFAEVKDALMYLLENNNYKKYNNIFITDLSLRNDALEILEKNPNIIDKINHFDHHKSELGKEKDYPFINTVYEINGVLTCGTELFYSYLLNFGMADTYGSFVEAVRSYDTYDFKKTGNMDGKYLTDILSIIGPELFIKRYSKLLNKPNISLFTEEDLEIIKQKEEEIKEYVNKCDESLIKTKIGDNNVGISISESFRSDVGNILSAKYKDELDYILIINLQRNQYSLRTVRDDIDVSQIAKNFDKNGGGHTKAAGAAITKDNIWVLTLASMELEKKLNKIKTLK